MSPSSRTDRWSAQSLQIAASVALLFAAVAWKYGVSTAGLFILCFLAAYATEFYLFRCVSALLRRQSLTTWKVALALLSLAADVALIYFGFGILLGMALGVFLLIDGLVLRFK